LVKKCGESKEKEGTNFTIVLDDESQNKDLLEFTILSASPLNSIRPGIQVLNADKLIGYSTFANLIDKKKDPLGVDEGDYFNVTLNLIVRKGPNLQSINMPPIH
jgi:hypothetical protein